MTDSYIRSCKIHQIINELKAAEVAEDVRLRGAGLPFQKSDFDVEALYLSLVGRSDAVIDTVLNALTATNTTEKDQQ